MIDLDHPNYQYVAARLLLYAVRKLVFQRLHEVPTVYDHVQKCVEKGVYDPTILDLYTKDEFNKLESFSLSLNTSVWDPPSLNTFLFELVNGAYGDVYRAKGLMNLPDGRSMFCNWIVSQESSQSLPLEEISAPNGRPASLSELVVQGINLDGFRILSTIDLCLLNDAVLEMHQMPLRDRQKEAIPST